MLGFLLRTDDWVGAEDPDWKANHQLSWAQLTDVREIGKVSQRRCRPHLLVLPYVCAVFCAIWMLLSDPKRCAETLSCEW